MKRHVTDVSAQCCASQGKSMTRTTQGERNAPVLYKASCSNRCLAPAGLDRRSLAFPCPSPRKCQPTFSNETTAVGRIPPLRGPFHHRFISNTSSRLLGRHPRCLDLYHNPILPGT